MKSAINRKSFDSRVTGSTTTHSDPTTIIRLDEVLSYVVEESLVGNEEGTSP